MEFDNPDPPSIIEETELLTDLMFRLSPFLAAGNLKKIQFNNINRFAKHSAITPPSFAPFIPIVS